MITHYLPRSVLKRFRGLTLHELDILTAQVEPRSIENAGSDEDLWPADVEKETMEFHDNRAAQLYRKKIANRHRIILSDVERFEFAQWLALFIPRVPNTLYQIKQQIEDERKVPKLGIEVIYENRASALGYLQKQNPSLYESALAELGKEQLEEVLLLQLTEKVRRGEMNIFPDPSATYNLYLRTMTIDDKAAMLCKYQWSWIYSSFGFVIGDNPLVRWHKKTGRWNYGIALEDVQISIPMSTNLCLILEMPLTGYTGHIARCTDDIAWRLNMRQRFAATHFVYAGEPRLLKPLRSPTFPPASPL